MRATQRNRNLNLYTWKHPLSPCRGSFQRYSRGTSLEQPGPEVLLWRQGRSQLHSDTTATPTQAPLADEVEARRREKLRGTSSDVVVDDGLGFDSSSAPRSAGRADRLAPRFIAEFPAGGGRSVALRSAIQIQIRLCVCTQQSRRVQPSSTPTVRSKNCHTSRRVLLNLVLNLVDYSSRQVQHPNHDPNPSRY
eukprot:SAG31_NODE_836_length_11643_cov_3.389813_9_plen_193_part_00